MADTTGEYKLFDDKRTEMQTVFDRMDTDEALYFLVPFKMMSLDGKKAMDDVANITLNDPLLYVQKSIAVIAGATMQTIVEGRNMTDKQTTKIEQFLEDVLYMIDERLVKRNMSGLDATINEQICVRGRIGARVCMRIDKAKGLIADILPLDTRCYVNEVNADGMVWGAPWFRQSKTQVENEYIQKGDKRVNLTDYNEVVDFWNNQKNIVFIEKQIAREQPNPYKYPPLIQVLCPAGSTLGTEQAVAHEGESILWADRNLWAEKNRAATILQTLNINSLFGALQYASSHGEGASKPGASPYKQKTVHPVEKGGGYLPMPIADIKNATTLFYSVLDTALQRGSLAAIDYGTLSFPLSSLAITRLSGSRDDIFLPRIQAKALFYQVLARMIIDQCLALDTTLELGKAGSENKYTPLDLKGDYTISFQFFTKTKEQDIADLSIANAAQNFLSRDTIRRTVLKLENPDEEERKFLSEQAEKVDEVLFLFRRADSLLESDKPTLKDQIEAYILCQRIETILQQRNSLGTLSPIENKPGGQPTPASKDELLGLLNAGGGGAGRGAATQGNQPVPLMGNEQPGAAQPAGGGANA
jgi:hypothetical protein